MAEPWLTFLTHRPERLHRLGDRLDTFDRNVALPAVLHAGAVIYRYGTSVAQAKGTIMPVLDSVPATLPDAIPDHELWLDLTFEKFATSEEAVDFLSLLSMPVDQGMSWNEALYRAEFEVEEDLLVWIGLVKGLTFNRRSGLEVKPGQDVPSEASFLYTTMGGATQILARRLVDRPLRCVRVTTLTGANVLH
jgi:hypothetical protein